MILVIRTDSPMAYIGLYDTDGHCSSEHEFELGRAMAKELPGHIERLVQGEAGGWQSLSGCVVFRGPGSFTGLRIGITLANTIAYSLGLSVAGGSGEHWATEAIVRLKRGENDRLVLPEYGAEAHITQPRK